MGKLICKPKDRVGTKDKNNLIYETDYSNLVTVLRSDDHKRSIKNCNRKRNEIAKCCWEAERNFSWDKERGVDRENRSIPSKIKELYSL